ERAGALLDEVLEARPDEPHARLARAELALWAADTSGAAIHAERLGDAPIAQRIFGVIDVIEGRAPQARARFEAAAAGAPRDPDTHAWLGELAIRDGRDEDAHEHITRAIAVASGRLFSGYVLRARVKIEEHVPAPGEAPSVPRLEAHLVDHLIPSLRAICPDHERAVESQHPDDWRALLDTALARMAGNRSSVATFMGEGRLQLVPALRDPRAESRRALERIRLEDPERLLAELDALASDFPSSPLPRAHQGELLAWLGRYDEARRTLEDAIAITRGTRWAYIGLSAIELVTGAPERALETSAHGVEVMRGTVGPAVHVHEGEAALRLGRLDQAERSLRIATETGPSRLGGWLNLALLELQRRDVAAAHRAFDEAFAIAPGLFSDAARAVGVALFHDDDALAPPEALARVLERAREMLRANRSSSCVTYFTSDGTLRFGRNTSRDAEPVHAKDDEELRFARGLLDQGLAALPQPGDRRSRSGRAP
ncbi:MAG: hypothetical protein KF901_33010, partial [Myxococcales bacterium]|nr:hypothetical protein [Myxococcales bacterium]